MIDFKSAVFLLSALLPCTAFAMEERPSGTLSCEIPDRKEPVTFSFGTEGSTVYLHVTGLPHADASYLYNDTQVIFHSPSSCLVETKSKTGFNPLEYKDCLYTGILDRLSGRLVVFSGNGLTEDNKPKTVLMRADAENSCILKRRLF